MPGFVGSLCRSHNFTHHISGRDWDCVILSLVRSNDANLVSDLLLDWRRLNVALTRAKQKLVIVADCSTLNAVPALAELFVVCLKNNWVVSLPKDCLSQ
jgi:DNA replication ATP-dependent helicase Dna2